MSSVQKDLPKKLEDQLNEVKYYKRRGSRGGSIDGDELTPADKLLAQLNQGSSCCAAPKNNENKLNYQSSSDDLFHQQKSTKPALLQKVFDDSYERRMYDELFGGGLLPNKSKLPAGSGYEATRRSSSQEKDFTSSLINRVKILEVENKEQRKQLTQQISQNLKLEEELALYKDSSNQQQQESIYRIQRLSSENQLLRQQISDMEEFLADYGLEWVGNPQVDEDNGDRESETSQEKHLAPFLEFQRCINQLNEIIYSEPAQIQTTAKKGRLVNPSELAEKITITYYRNGLMINRGPFRPISAPSYRSFMQDILDGYFPSEFRDQYPDGVIFELKNKEKSVYSEEKPAASSAPSSSSSATGDDFLSMKDFLSRLPKTVIQKNGDVLDLQNQLRLRLSAENPPSRQSLAPSKGEEWIENRVAAGKQPHRVVSLPTEAAEQLQTKPQLAATRLQVKWREGISYLVVMYAYQTVADLRRLIQREHKDEEVSFEFRRAFPNRKLEEYETFQTADLVPNGVVHTLFR